jgi:Chalcone isomerase-like
MATRLLGFLLAAAFPIHAVAAEVAGVQLADRIQVEGAALELNGAGLRKRLFFQVYAIGLYVQNKSTAAAEVVSSPGPKRVQIHMLRDVGAEQFTEALVEGLKANHTEAEFTALGPSLQRLSAIMTQMKDAREGMRIALDWTGSGTRVIVDGKPAGDAIPGADFYRALLRIWLGEQPVQEDLKKALLGQPA